MGPAGQQPSTGAKRSGVSNPNLNHRIIEKKFIQGTKNQIRAGSGVGPCPPCGSPQGIIL